MNVIKINVVEIVNSIIDAFVTRFNIQPVWLPLAVSARCVCVCVCVHACVCVCVYCVFVCYGSMQRPVLDSLTLGSLCIVCASY